jgi:molecular chaperone DnaK
MNSGRAIGIDLGTTFSAVAWVNETGHSALVPNGDGEFLTPSVVLFEETGVVVGKEAKRVAVVYPDRVAACVKRDMGRPVYSRPIAGQYLPPEVIQSYILKRLKDDALRTVKDCPGVVITVPAYFDDPRRRATFHAGELAGLNVLDIINEPTAAALAFGEELGYLTRTGGARGHQNVLVYDLGGGTFDVTLIEMQAGNLRTIATDGDVQLGGFDWDMRLVDYMAEVFIHQHHDDPRRSPSTLQQMLADAEAAKHALSARSRAMVNLAHRGNTTHVVLSRELFEERTSDLLERTRYTTRQLLATAGMEWKDIHRVLLTGGSTRMPMVPRMLKELSGMEPDYCVNPDEAVARGAAIYANFLVAWRGMAGDKPAFDVSNVNSHSLGVEGTDPQTGRRRNRVLISRNTRLPAQRTEEFITQTPGQRSVVVHVLEGESRDPDECSLIGRTVLRDLPRDLPQGSPVEITFRYEANGRLMVLAQLKGTARVVKLELERSATMTPDRLTRWKHVVQTDAGMASFGTVGPELAQLNRDAEELGLTLPPE